MSTTIHSSIRQPVLSDESRRNMGGFYYQKDFITKEGLELSLYWWRDVCGASISGKRNNNDKDTVAGMF